MILIDEASLLDTVADGAGNEEWSAAMVAMMGRKGTRDAVVRRMVGMTPNERTGFLVRAMYLMENRSDALTALERNNLLSTIAVTMWAEGDSESAAVVVGIVLMDDPEHRMAQLMSVVMQAFSYAAWAEKFSSTVTVQDCLDFQD